MNIITLVQNLFLRIFMEIYPILHGHFVSYLLYLAVLCALAKLNLMLIGKYKKTKSNIDTAIRLSLFATQGFLTVYIVWFILIHFHTFRILGV
jgi:hypothetical protein